MLTVYDKYLIDILQDFYQAEETSAIVKSLIEIGVVDPVRCKILVVREYVNKMVKNGCGKVDSMYEAAEKFCCSYEYVRKCMYYYKYINLTN